MLIRAMMEWAKERKTTLRLRGRLQISLLQIFFEEEKVALKCFEDIHDTH